MTTWAKLGLFLTNPFVALFLSCLSAFIGSGGLKDLLDRTPANTTPTQALPAIGLDAPSIQAQVSSSISNGVSTAIDNLVRQKIGEINAQVSSAVNGVLPSGKGIAASETSAAEIAQTAVSNPWALFGIAAVLLTVTFVVKQARGLAVEAGSGVKSTYSEAKDMGTSANRSLSERG